MSDQALFGAASLGSPSEHPQWRLQEVQVANWGTFDGQIYRVPVARSGHLITGSSGSGKSTLLDAIAAVLTPDKWLRFNAAAQGLGPRADQRSTVSYVRGAWQRQADADEDRIVTQYLLAQGDLERGASAIREWERENGQPGASLLRERHGDRSG